VAISIDVNKASLNKVRADVAQVRKNLANIDEPMAKISILLDRWVQKNFRSEGGNVGGWEPFALGGRPGPKGIDTSAKLLQDTGRLRASFKPFADANKAGIGSALEYSITHEEGRGVPARRMLPKRKEIEAQVQRLMETALTKGLK